MPYPGSHNWRQLGVLGMGLGVRNPCLGSSGSQMGPPSYEIAVHVQTLLESCSIKGTPWDCWETAALSSPCTSIHTTFSEVRFRTWSLCLQLFQTNPVWGLKFSSNDPSSDRESMTILSCPAGEGRNQGPELLMHILICALLSICISEKEWVKFGIGSTPVKCISLRKVSGALRWSTVLTSSLWCPDEDAANSPWHSWQNGNR